MLREKQLGLLFCQEVIEDSNINQIKVMGKFHSYLHHKASIHAMTLIASVWQRVKV